MGLASSRLEGPASSWGGMQWFASWVGMQPMAASWAQLGVQRPSISGRRQRHSCTALLAARLCGGTALLMLRFSSCPQDSVLRPLSKLPRVYCVQHAMFLTLAAAPHFCLQEEERERRMDFIPDESAINTEAIEVR